jgi:hypothetical protein
MNEKKLPTREELELGLDPNKYTDKPFNTADYHNALPQDPLAQEVEKMKQIKAQQVSVLGEEPPPPTDDERTKIKEEMIKRMRGF